MSNVRAGFVIGFLMATAVTLCSPAGAAPGIAAEIGNPEHKILGGPDEEGDLEISVKVTVRNTADTDLTTQVIVQALDRDGFEVYEFILSDLVKGNQTRVLTDMNYIKEGVYRMIQTWRVEAVSLRPGLPDTTAKPTKGIAAN